MAEFVVLLSRQVHLSQPTSNGGSFFDVPINTVVLQGQGQVTSAYIVETQNGRWPGRVGIVM
jgi:hypothetical protein